MGGHFLGPTLDIIKPDRICESADGDQYAYYFAEGRPHRRAFVARDEDGGLVLGLEDCEADSLSLRDLDALDDAVACEIRDWVSGGGRG